MKIKNLVTAAIISCCITSCSSNEASQESNTTSTNTVSLTPSNFNSDTAYQYIIDQLAFGPRVPGTKAQTECAKFLEHSLYKYCDTVYVQKTQVTAGNGKTLPCYNIVGSINPSAKTRYLMLAHWDSRPWADRDIKDTAQAIEAADDGASGVAVLLEVARQLKTNSTNSDVGYDILFVDVEDYGKPEWGDDSYCLGSQYWAKNPHVPGYTAKFGILLDMVGARNATFKPEGYSEQYAPNVVQLVWQAARNAGYSSYFPYEPARTAITDDHKYINEIAQIPTIDIIFLDFTSRTGFGNHWHTHNDNISVIDKNTLKAVGQTLLQALFETTSN